MPRKSRQAAPPVEPDDGDISSNERAAVEDALGEIPDLVQNPPNVQIVDRSDEPEPKIEPEPGSATPSPATAAGRRQSSEPEPPAKPPEAIVKDDDPLAKEIDAEIAKLPAPKTDRERGAISAMREFVKTKLGQTRKEIDELKPKFQKLEEDYNHLKDVATPEQVERWKEMEHFISTREVENLPRWKEYDAVVNRISSDAASLLERFGVKQPILKAIEGRGGIIAFSRSQEPAGAGWKNEDGTPMTNEQWFKTHIFSKLDDMQKGEFTALTAEAYKKQREKDSAIEAAKKDAGKTLADENAKSWDDFNNRANSKLKELIDKHLTEMGLPIEAAVIPEDASPEEKAKLEKFNEDWKRGDEYVKKYILAQSPEDRAQVAFDGAFAVYLRSQNKGLKDELSAAKKERDDLQKKLDGIKESRAMSRLRNAPPVTANDQTPDSQLSDAEAVERNL